LDSKNADLGLELGHHLKQCELVVIYEVKTLPEKYDGEKFAVPNFT